MTDKDCAESTPFRPLNIAILTVSDSRTPENDTSGDTLAERIQTAGHVLADRQLLPDDIFQLRACVSQWIADVGVDSVLLTGGTGITGRDSTPEAIRPLLVREIPGFGELFRYLSLDDIGTSTIQSRALAGVANATLIFALPGSTGACRLAWDKIIGPQFDSRTGPCNFIALIPRLNE